MILKPQLVFCIALIILTLSNSNAQNDYSFDHQSKSEFDYSRFDKEIFYKKNLFEDAVPQKFLKNKRKSEDL